MRKSRLHYLQNEEDIEDEDLDEMNDVDEDNNTKVYGLDTKKGAQTYKFADLAELVVEKDTDDFDDDLDESNSDDDYLSEGGESTG